MRTSGIRTKVSAQPAPKRRRFTAYQGRVLSQWCVATTARSSGLTVAGNLRLNTTWTPLQQAYDEHRRVQFQGPVTEADTKDSALLARTQLEVELTSLNVFADNQGKPVTLVNFSADPATVEPLLNDESRQRKETS